MKLIESNVEYIPQAEGLEGIYKMIELAGRTAYKSEDKITEGSAKRFADRMIANNHCYTGDVEVLTNEGWIKWKEYKSQQVAVINPDLSFKGFEEPLRTIRHTYDGIFYDYPNLGIKVTDKHRMFGLHRTSNNDFYNNNNYVCFECNTPYKDQNGRVKTQGERTFKTPRHCSKPTNTNPYMELVGFWLGDGCYNETTKNKLVFHLKKKRKIEYIRNLAKQLGYKFTEGKGAYYRIEENNIGALFNAAYYSNKEKYLDTKTYYTSIDIHSIITGLINSDGSCSTNRKTIMYTSSSEDIIKWICMYAPLAGYTVSYNGICYQGTNKHKPLHRVLFLDTDYTINNDSRSKKSKVIVSKETQDVFCVTVSTGLIMVRGTNGVTSVCGNCATLEHGTVYLKRKVDVTDVRNEIFIDFYKNNPYSRAVFSNGICYVTTNLRVLQENNCLDDLKYICEYTVTHEKRYTFKFTCDRGISHELVRHRVFSFLQESTRFCNYMMDKFGNEITYIIPHYLPELKEGRYINHEGDWYSDLEYADPTDIIMKDSETHNKWNSMLHCFSMAEQEYQYLLKIGATPQEARAVLPNALKTELVMTGFSSDWRHLLDLRYFEKTGPVHPDMKVLMQKLSALMHVTGVWDDVMKQPSKFD